MPSAQQSFSNADLSVIVGFGVGVNFKGGGGGANLRNALVTFFVFGMKLLWDDINNIP